MSAEPAPGLAPADEDQRILMHGMSWWQFETILAARGDNPVPRMAYAHHTIELMSPSRKHERKKSNLGALVEAYAYAKDIWFDPFASTTLKNDGVEKAVEPDESYAFREGADVPDLAIEVVYRSGGLDKLDLYAGLGVREVWFWMSDRLQAYVLDEDGRYVRIAKSVGLPGLEIAELEPFAAREDVFEAVKAFRARLAG